MTSNPEFKGDKVTPLVDAKYVRNSTRYRHSYNHALLRGVTSNDVQ